MRQKETFSFDTPLHLEENRWMLALTSLEVKNPVFNVTEKKYKVQEEKDTQKMKQFYKMDWGTPSKRIIFKKID